MAKKKSSGTPADGVPADGVSASPPSKKKVGTSRKRADVAKTMLWAAPVVVLVAAGIAFVSRSGQAPQSPRTDAAQRRDAAHPRRDSPPPGRDASSKTENSSGQLPQGWGSATDPTSGKTYYYQIATRETQWEFPTSAAGEEAASAAKPSLTGHNWNAAAEGEDKECAGWAKQGECTANPEFMRAKCKVTCERADAARTSSTGELVDSWKEPGECIAWAASGECEINKGFMYRSCAYSCSPEARAAQEKKLAASLAEYNVRCPRDASMLPALSPGMMNATFERVMLEFRDLKPELISNDPPVVLFHAFLSDAEADAFIGHGKGKYTESRGVGFSADGKMTDVKTEIRTSRHTWCQERSCLNDPLVQAVQQRVSDVTQTPVANAEFAQLVYYHACPSERDPSCAFYKRHSDYIDGDRHRVQGVRIFTMFMYLNDLPEGAGGGTKFTDLKPPVTFKPEKGKAVLWPSVLADAPNNIDTRTHHEALPVLLGEKYGANFWIHQYDFRTAHSKGCTMG
jgi:hypothetical protein